VAISNKEGAVPREHPAVREKGRLRRLSFDPGIRAKSGGFARQFRGTELDMHFSPSSDLVPGRGFSNTLRNEGQTMVAVMLELGAN
jgi:hypothetical protein